MKLKNLRTALLAVAAAVYSVAAQAGSMYLDIPGIAGENPTPGYPDAMEVQSLNLIPNQFSIIKQVDKASPQMIEAVTAGTHFPSASMLFYNSAPSGPPDAALVFQDVLPSAYQLETGGQIPLEKVTFDFTAVTQSIPEPGSFTMLITAVVFIGAAAHVRRRIGAV
jgi:type VI protein secretion system component Hcp